MAKKTFNIITIGCQMNKSDSERIASYLDELGYQKINERKDFFYILFSSPGGNVSNGITIYNFLRALPVRMIIHNIGIVDSIANVIFLGIDERYAVPHSSFLLL